MATVAKPAGSSGSGSSEGYTTPTTGTGGRNIDDKKRRRMESNRESARRSRQRKQQHLDDLIKQASQLTRENEEFGKKIGEYSNAFAAVESQNVVLRSEKDRLATRLASLENVVEIAKVVRGNPPSSSNASVNNHDGGLLYEMLMNGNYDDDVGDDDPMMKPWQLPNHSMPVIASSGLRY